VRLGNQRPVKAAVLLCAVLCAAPQISAQVGGIPPPYEGWVPQDRVAPTFVVTEQYDPITATWRYGYAIANGLSAEQDIWAFCVRVDAWSTNTDGPQGWTAIAPSEATFRPFGPGMRNVLFMADLPTEFEGPYWSPSDYQIPPGGSLAGFADESPYPPGYARTYAQGYAPVPFPPLDDDEAYYAMNPIPHDTTNSQRGWTLGPTVYREVVTGGNRRPATDGFLGFMNLAEKGSVLIDPAPIALEFSLNRETVDQETLEVKLNGVAVTAAFLPGPADGADLVGVFRIGSSPLQAGKNVLLTSVEGLVPGTTHTAKDTDRIVFNVIADWDGSLTSNGLHNLPRPEPGLE